MVTHSTRLSAREWEVLELIARGLQQQEVAQELYLSPHTVHHYSWTIRVKLGARNTAHAVYLAMVEQDGSCGA